MKPIGRSRLLREPGLPGNFNCEPVARMGGTGALYGEEMGRLPQTRSVKHKNTFPVRDLLWTS